MLILRFFRYKNTHWDEIDSSLIAFLLDQWGMFSCHASSRTLCTIQTILNLCEASRLSQIFKRASFHSFLRL
jgi:hypothetical protein